MKRTLIRNARFVAVLFGILSMGYVDESHALEYFGSFDITLADQYDGIENILLLERYASGSGTVTGFSIGSGQSTITNPFPYNSTDLPTSFLLFGLIPIDSTEFRVVLFMNDATSDFADGKEWATLFPTTDETILATAIFVATTSTVQSEIEAAFSTIFHFADNDANSIPGPNSTTLSAQFVPENTFKVVAFSTGEIIGNGISRLTPVPEPSTYFMGAASMAVVGAIRIFRRQGGVASTSS